MRLVVRPVRIHPGKSPHTLGLLAPSWKTVKKKKPDDVDIPLVLEEGQEFGRGRIGPFFCEEVTAFQRLAGHPGG